jgi:hypothetical protein
MNKKLFLVIITSILIFFISCEKTDDNGVVRTYYQFKNNTTQSVELKLVDRTLETFETYVIEPNQEKTFLSECLGVGNKGICTDLTRLNKIQLKFLTDNTCLIDYDKLNNESLYDNFSNEIYNTNNYTLIYLIDDEEVGDAVPCF